MKIYAGVRIGAARDKQQCDDRLLIKDVILKEDYYEAEINEKNIILAVADGVGGRACGYLAAEMGLQHLSMFDKSGGLQAVTHCLHEANALVRQEGQKEESKGMASTLSLLYIGEEENHILHLGDSRIYHYRMLQGFPVLRRLTTDQNLLNLWMQLPENEGRAPEELMEDQSWRKITSYMGMPKASLRDALQTIEKVSAGGTFILTSDGVHDFLEHHRMEEILGSAKNGREKIEAMMEEAVNNGSLDDQSILIVELD